MLIKLDKLGFEFDRYTYDFSKHTIPENAKDWIKKQKKYYKNYYDEKTKEIIILLTKYSMKAFNFFLDKPEKIEDRDKYLKDLLKKYDFSLLIKLIYKYTLNSPILKNNITVYSGFNRKDYEDFVENKKIYSSKRFHSASFDEKHALSYAIIGRRGVYSKVNKKPFILFHITISPNTKCFYYEFENQVVFLPNTQFKKYKKNRIIYSKFETLDGIFKSNKKHKIEIVYLKTIPNDKLYQQFKNEYLN